MDIGRRIKEVREEYGMSGVVLARRAGVTSAHLNMIEHGSRTPSLGLLERIARELRTEPAEFLREPAVPLGETSETGSPQVVRERLQEHFENVRQNEVDYLNHKVIADLWRLALPGEKPEAHFVPEDIDTDRIWQFLEHALGAHNVFGPEEAERIRRGAVRKAALAR